MTDPIYPWMPHGTHFIVELRADKTMEFTITIPKNSWFGMLEVEISLASHDFIKYTAKSAAAPTADDIVDMYSDLENTAFLKDEI